MKRYEKNLLLALVTTAGVAFIGGVLSLLFQLRGEALHYAYAAVTLLGCVVSFGSVGHAVSDLSLPPLHRNLGPSGLSQIQRRLEENAK